MNKFLNSALALAVASSLGYAGTSSSSDWAGLDQEMNLVSSLGQKGGSGPEMGALIRSSIQFSNDDGYQVGTEDLRGMTFEDVLLWAQGQIGNYWWRVNFDFADNNSGLPTNSGFDGIHGAVLQDAYARWNCSDTLHLTWGQFKAPVLRSASVSRSKLLFIDRSVMGQAFDSFDPGVMLSGTMEQFTWDVAVQNGADGASEDVAYNARAEYNFNNGAGSMEGGYGMGDGTHGTVGVSYYKDQDQTIDAKAISVDAAFSFAGRFTASGEFSDLDQEVATFLVPGVFVFTDDAKPWSIVGSYVIQPNEWEVALRYQKIDDDNDSKIWTGGVNWYQSGHNAKWQFNVSDVKSDDNTIEGTLFQLGLSIGSES